MLKKENYLSSGEAIAITEDEEHVNRREDTTAKQPYLRDYISQLAEKQYTGLPTSIYTTVDENMSREIKDIADQTIYKLSWKDVSDYGVLVLDKQTNELRVMLGGMAYDGKAGQVNATMSINQPGSAVKPFTYALAFQEL